MKFTNYIDKNCGLFEFIGITFGFMNYELIRNMNFIRIAIFLSLHSGSRRLRCVLASKGSFFCQSCSS